MNETLQLTVNGMTCGGCETSVKRALLRTAGIEDVTASHAENMVNVTFDPDKVSPAAIREQIEALGYEVNQE